MINKRTPHCFICQIPITETNCMVMIIPSIIGTKSPIRLMDGINSIGNASNISTMAIILVTLIILGRLTTAMLISTNCFYGV